VKRFAVIFALFGLVLLAGAQKVRYSGQSVVRANLVNANQVALVETLGIDVWSEGIGVGYVDLRVSSIQLQKLRQAGVTYSVLIPDVQRLIDQQQRSGPHAQGLWDSYQTWETIEAQLASWETLYPTICKRVNIGTSLDGKPITGIRITSAANTAPVEHGSRKVGVIYFGAEHAREWITVPVVLYIANYLLTGYGTDARATAIVNNMEIYCVPIFNVDGYRYTWSNQRLWRKNRRNNGGGNYGVDINRNWGHHWGEEGASTNPSSETFRGANAFSEPETLALANFELANPRIKGHLDYHSYSQLILYPWGYQAANPPDNSIYNAETGRMAQLFARSSGRSYDYGPIYATIYPASGNSVDWSYGVAGTKAITIELPDTGEYGFLLPESQILSVCTEQLEGAVDYALWIQQLNKEPAKKKS